MHAAWARTKDRWFNYFLVILEYILLPVVVAVIVSAAALMAAPSIISSIKDPNANAALQVILAALAIILPVATIVGAVYRNIVGAIALVKTVIDKEKNRKKTIAESKALIFPYLHFITILTLLNIGLLPFIPLSLLILSLYMQIWSTFALFSFVTEEKRGAYNIWKAIAVLKANFWEITGRTILIQLSATIVVNSGNILMALSGAAKNPDLRAAASSFQFLATIASFIVQVFVTAYMYELYIRVKPPTDVKTPKLLIGFSVLGWIVLVGLAAFGINYVINQLPQWLASPASR